MTDRSPASLRLILLGRLLPALLILLIAGAATAYWIAWRSATKAYDRALYDTALAIVGQLQPLNGTLPQRPLSAQARAVLLTDKYDRVFYAIRDDASGANIDGEAALPLPSGEMSEALDHEGRAYYDGALGGIPIRIAALRQEIDGVPMTVLAGETMVKRNALVREILFGMLLPELLLALVSIAVVWFGIRGGLHPLAALRHELATRSPADLRPVNVVVPEEVAPVLTEINRLLGRLQHSLDSQRNFVSDAAHQLRTPIAALQAQVEAATQEGPESASRLAGILAAARRLAHLVDQLLALARAEPSLPQTQNDIDLQTLARQIAETWLPVAIPRHIDLGFDLAPAHLRGNPLLLQELLGNLVDNALRHTPAGGSVTLSCGETDRETWLSVEDSGPGVAEHERERIFERFYRSPASTGEGSGLGLAIVREIARQHGGQVEVGQSATLGGARFLVRFTRASAAV